MIEKRNDIVHQRGHVQGLAVCWHLRLTMAAHVHSHNTIVAAKGWNPWAKPLRVRHCAMQHKDGRGVRPRIRKVIYEEIKF
jgi:hypothetical protein